ncbi:MAG TPA: carboxylating nicotinate-nucleotide diphosphorylase [candidate division Zixibacteria bacterium]
MLSKDSHIRNLIDLALSEDIGSGDITSQTLIPGSLTGKAVIAAKQEGIIAGLEIAKKVFQSVDSRIVFKYLKKDGGQVKAKESIALIQGKVRSILSAERTALNFLQRLSGIASLTAKYVEKIKGTKTKILDTRKTAPGMRILEKYAVKMGGGENHRMGLYDMILIKENHIKAAGGISKAVKKAKSKCGKRKIEVEVRDFKEVIEASLTDADWIMLDNMNVREIKKAVNHIRSANQKIKIEVSGGVTLKNVRYIALTGVDFISVGALTHSAPALDLSLVLL